MITTLLDQLIKTGVAMIKIKKLKIDKSNFNCLTNKKTTTVISKQVDELIKAGMAMLLRGAKCECTFKENYDRLKENKIFLNNIQNQTTATKIIFPTSAKLLK